MKKSYALFTCLLLIFSLCACNLPQTGTPTGTSSDIVATRVVMTLAVLTQSAPSLTPQSTFTLSQPTNTQPVVPSPTLTSAFTATITPTITQTPTITITQAPTNTSIPKPGTISGSISGYPYGALPSLTIVAFGQQPPYNYSYLVTTPGTAYFSMNNNYTLPGQYQVVAYDSSDNRGGCPGLITVVSEQTVSCDISNWSGGYPPRPSGVPAP